jgi:PAB-dependent poly(A)-specific ribonuclease subunit 3
MANINPEAQAWTPNVQPKTSSTPAVKRLQAGSANSPYWSPGQQQQQQSTSESEGKANFSSSAANGAVTFVPGRGVMNADVQEYQPAQTTTNVAVPYSNTNSYMSNATNSDSYTGRGVTNSTTSLNQQAPVTSSSTSNNIINSNITIGGTMGDGSNAARMANSNKYDKSAAEFQQGGYDQLLEMSDAQNGDRYLAGPVIAEAPKRRTIRSFFMPTRMRERFWHMDAVSLRQLKPDDEIVKEIPKGYHCIDPLDMEGKPRGTAGSFGYPSSVYKVVSEKTGLIHALRRFDNIKTNPKVTQQVLRVWNETRGTMHPNIVTLRAAFVHQRALFFTHDYFAGAKTIRECYLSGAHIQPLPEPLLWSFMCQIVTALRHLHSRNLACRVLDPRHIIVTGPNRLRINCIGILDVLEVDSKKTVVKLQEEDMFALGRLLLSLATANTMAIQNLQRSIDFVISKYSEEFKILICGLLLSKKRPSVFEVCTQFSGRFLGELDMMYKHNDAMENEARKQFGCGRLARLLMKLGMINERPELRMDKQWSETGNRYIIKLFRNYVFHQRGKEGEPLIDFGHVIECLNKLDAGVDEKILLTSPDGKSIVVASFLEIRRLLDEAFMELVSNANGPGVKDVNQMYQQAQMQMQQMQQQQQMMMAQHGMYGGM